MAQKRSKKTGRFLKGKRKTTKKGNRRKGAVRGARLAYDATKRKKRKKRKRRTKKRTSFTRGVI